MLHYLFSFFILLITFTSNELFALVSKEDLQSVIESSRLYIKPITPEDKNLFKELCDDATQDYINPCWSLGVGMQYEDYLFESALLAPCSSQILWVIFDKHSSSKISLNNTLLLSSAAWE